MFTVRISDEYQEERSWIEHIPATFDLHGEIVQAKKNRNILRKVAHKGRMYNIKSFHIPRFFNRIIYTFFRKSKALRSYEHAFILREKGIGTPVPIALLTEKLGGLIARSFYVSKQLSDEYQEIRYCYRGPLAGNEETLTAFAQFTAKVHDSGVYHTDYSPGNILFKHNETTGEYDFQLVDINRMKFCEVSMEMGCKNWARLFECDEIYEFVARQYAKARGFDEEKSVALIMKAQNDFNKKKIRKRKLKKLIGKKD